MTSDFFAATNDGPKRPALRQIIVRDRRQLAHHLGWPPGALDTCERVERDHPGWTVSWLPPNDVPGHERPACYWARREWPAYEAHAGGEAELVKAIADAPAGSMWSA
jgi:hypothetical protein